MSDSENDQPQGDISNTPARKRSRTTPEWRINSQTFESPDAAVTFLKECKSKAKAPKWWSNFEVGHENKDGQAWVYMQCKDPMCEAKLSAQNPAQRASHLTKQDSGRFKCSKRHACTA